MIHNILLVFVASIVLIWSMYALYKSSDYAFERRRHNQKTYGFIIISALLYIILSFRWVIFDSGSKIGAVDDLSWNLSELLNFYIYSRLLYYSLKRNLGEKK